MGAAAALAARLAGYRRFVRNVRKNAQPMADGEILRLARDMEERLGIKRMPQICERSFRTCHAGASQTGDFFPRRHGLCF